MSTSNGKPELPVRIELRKSQWQLALMKVEREVLMKKVSELAEHLTIEQTAIPEAGLAITRMIDSVSGTPFNLGEIPVSTAAVRITAEDGRLAAGSSTIMLDDAQQAWAVAVCDAVLRGRLKGWQEVASLVEQGLDELDRLKAEREKILAVTKVDFAELSQEE